MGIRRARVTWLAVIHGLPGEGTTRGPYHMKISRAETPKRESRARKSSSPGLSSACRVQTASVTQYAITWVSGGGVSARSIFSVK